MEIFVNSENLQKFNSILQETGHDELFDPEEYCSYHKKKSKHYYCLFHRTLSCETCAEMMHSKGECQIADFHQIEAIDNENEEEITFNKSCEENIQSPSLSVKSDMV
jgi:hypothetical protein